MNVLSKRPKATDILALVREGGKLKLPDEKGLRMMKSMAQRATSWNSKASRLLMPVPGEKRPYDMKELKNILAMADDIPLRMRLEPRLLAVIEDNGERHCICGGPSDGRMMLCCDKCDNWFHGHCVGLTTEESNSVGEWMCPSCKGLPSALPENAISHFHDAYGPEEEDDTSSSSEDEDVVSGAHRVAKLWPPFGLLTSNRAIEVLGQNLCSLPDDTGPWDGGALHMVRSAKQSVKAVAKIQQPKKVAVTREKIPTPPRLLKRPGQTPVSNPMQGVARAEKAANGVRSIQTNFNTDDPKCARTLSQAKVAQATALTSQEAAAGNANNCISTPSVVNPQLKPSNDSTTFGVQGGTSGHRNPSECTSSTHTSNHKMDHQLEMPSDEMQSVAQLLSMRGIVVAPLKDGSI